MSATPVRVLFSVDGSRAFVAHQNGGLGPITVLDTATHAPVATVDTPGGVIAIARPADGRRLFFGLVNVASLLELTPDAGGYDSRSFPAPGTGVATVGLAFDDARQALYGTNDARTVFRYELPTGTNAVSLPQPGASPKQVAYSPSTSTLYVANESGGLLAFRAGASALTPLPFVAADGGSTTGWGLALTPDGKELWISDSSGGVLRIVNLASLEVRVVGGVGKPRDIAFEALGSEAVVANELGEVLFLK